MHTARSQDGQTYTEDSDTKSRVSNQGLQLISAQHIEARLAAVGILARRQAVFAPRLV